MKSFHGVLSHDVGAPGGRSHPAQSAGEAHDATSGGIPDQGQKALDSGNDGEHVDLGDLAVGLHGGPLDLKATSYLIYDSDIFLPQICFL